MKEFFKKNLVIILAFALPITLVVFVALGVYLSSLFLSTDYNFAYAICSDGSGYRCSAYLQERYSVVNGKLVVNNVDFTELDSSLDSKENYSARLFLHNTKNNESREITVEEAQKLNLSGLLTSPDGVTVSSRDDRGSDFFFFVDTGDSSGYYLTQGKKQSKLNLINDDGYYYQDKFKFIGWVLPGRNQ